MLVLGSYVKDVLLVNDGGFVPGDPHLLSAFHNEAQVCFCSPISHFLCQDGLILFHLEVCGDFSS